MIHQFTQANYHLICDRLALADPDMSNILTTFGYPPLWSRPNTFETLVHIILEQQVSLASALSALNKMRERVQEITPARVLLLTDAEFKACYFSRQKTAYTKYLAEALLSGHIDLLSFEKMEDDAIRQQLTALKGIGNWTVDVYLMFVLKRADIFPIGDLAIVNAIKRLKNMPKVTPREELLLIAEQWRPYRTVASMMLWHYYLSKRVTFKSPPVGETS